MKYFVILIFLVFLSINAYSYSNYTHNTGTIQVTVFDDGQIGHDGTSGIGFIFDNSSDALYRGGLIIGNAQHGIIGQIGSFSINDFWFHLPIQQFQNNLNFNEVTMCSFTDTFATNPLNIQIYQQTFSNSGDDFIFITYLIENRSNIDLNGIYVGIFADWDVGNYAQNRGGYGLTRNLAYQYEFGGNNNPNYYGVVALNGLAGARVTTHGTSDSIRTQAFTWISTFLNEPITVNGDYRTYIGSGPYDIPANEYVYVGFALVAGNSLADLQTNANIAQQKWNNHTVSMPFIVHRGPQYYHGTLNNFPVQAKIFDGSGIMDTHLTFITSNGDSFSISPISINDLNYYFEIPAQAPGTIVHYKITAISQISNSVTTDTFTYISGQFLGDPPITAYAYSYNGLQTQKVAIKINVPSGYSTDLYNIVLLTSGGWQSTVHTDSITVHIWGETNDLPGPDLITPKRIKISESEHGTIVDFSSNPIHGLNGNFYIGFSLDLQDTIYVLGIHPSNYHHTFLHNGTQWMLVDKDHYAYAVTGEYQPLGINKNSNNNFNNFVLKTNYPNPFNSTTVIEYNLPQEEEVTLVIYNTLGQKIRTLVHRKQPAGLYRVQWDGLDEKGKPVPSGIYLYQLKTKKESISFNRVKKMILMK